MVFLLIKDVQRIFGDKCYDTALKRVRVVKDAYSIKDRRITLDELCKYYDFDYDTVWKELKQLR